MGRVSSETSFVSKQPKLEPKLVLALSETRRLFRLLRKNSSKFVKISTFLISHTISSVCFGCFDTSPKHQNKLKEKILGFAKNKPKNNRNRLSFNLFRFEPRKKINGFEDPLIVNVFKRFFLFVSTKFCLFRYRSKTPKQTERNQKKCFLVSRNKPKKLPKQIEFRFVSVRTEKKK
jgi:hypothetical protein